MDPFSCLPRRFALPSAVVLASVAALALPGAASAKTFVSHVPDPTGDAKASSHDIKSVRVAYNRRSGALSVSLTVAGSIDQNSDDGVFVYLSDLVNGKCQKPVMLIGGVFSHGNGAVAQRMNGTGVIGNQYDGTGSVDGDTFSLRVKNRALAGTTVGCTGALIASAPPKGEKPTIFDKTTGNDGFFG